MSMLKIFRTVIIFLVAGAVIIPFMIAMFGLGDAGFMNAGWILPLVALVFGVPFVAFLFLLEHAHKSLQVKNQKRASHIFLMVLLVVLGYVLFRSLPLHYFNSEQQILDHFSEIRPQMLVQDGSGFYEGCYVEEVRSFLKEFPTARCQDSSRGFLLFIPYSNRYICTDLDTLPMTVTNPPFGLSCGV